ncbi:MAG: hypothetical protein GXP42_09535 [Chloroflexi bacterium]|nr:hypothetical protein [Chloroflexota bacterium]
MTLVAATSKPSTRSPARRLLLLVILASAAFLRFYALDGQSFWADEGNSVVLASRGAAEIARAAAADIHPPAYYLLLAGWGKLFGLGEIGARSLSAILGVLLVWVIYRLGERLQRNSGLVAAALAAVNPFLIYYSQEARMYELLALCAAVTAYALLAWLQAGRDENAVSSRSQWGLALLYFGFAVLGLYTHYAFPIHLIALNLIGLTWLMVHRREPARAQTRNWLLLQMAVGLTFLPWLPTALRQLTVWPAPAATLTGAEAMQESFRLFLCGPIPCEPTTLTIVLSLGLMIMAAFPWAPENDGWLAWTAPLIWLTAPLLAMLFFGVFSPVFFKFLLIAAPAFLLLLAVGVMRWDEWMGEKRRERERAKGQESKEANARPDERTSRRASALSMISVGIITLALMLPSFEVLDRYYHDPEVARDDYRGIAAYIKAVAGPDDAVILDAPGQIDAFSQYDHGPAALYPLPETRPPDAEATRARLEAILAQSKRIYAVYWAVEQADPDRIVESYLAERAFKAWDAWIGNLRFAAYSAEPAPEPVPFPNPPQFGPAIQLDAAGISIDPLQPGDIARARLRWFATQSLDVNYKITLQLLDPANQVVAQVDSEPVGGQRPTTTWQPWETIDDPYGLAIPLATPPGAYRLILAMYDAASGQRLPVRTAERIDDHLPLGQITIIPPATAPPLAILPIRHRTEQTMGPFRFLGHNRYKQGFAHAPETPLNPGDPLHLTTFWLAESPLQGDYSFALLLDGRQLARFPLAGPNYPTSRWLPGLPWRGEHTVFLPADMATGREHNLSLVLIDPQGGTVGDPIELEPDLIY